MAKVHLLTNPRSGSGRGASTGGVIAELRAHVDVVDLTGATAEESTRALREAVDRGDVERVVVSGGDGLVHLAIHELAESAIVVALAPAGTGNDFAAALGIDAPTVESLLASPGPCDLLRITPLDDPTSTRWVASVAIVGFPADINARANRLRAPLGAAKYTVAAALELPRYRRRRLDVVLDEEALSLDTGMLAIGNTRFFGGGMLACPDASHDDARLHLTSIEGVGRLGILRHLAQRSGGSADRTEVLRRQGRIVTLRSSSTRTSETVWGDGEPIASLPIDIEVVPNALAVAGL